MASDSTIQFAPFRSFVDPSFFQVLADKKLNEYKLESDEKHLVGSYSIPVTRNASSSGIFTLSGSSFDKLTRTDDLISPGVLLNVNTVEEFRSIDKSSLIRAQGGQIHDAIADRSVEDDPSQLASFFLLTFSDLKKYKFYYWFAFPVIQSDWRFSELDPILPVSRSQRNQLVDAVEQWRSEVSPNQFGFFLIDCSQDEFKLGKLSEWDEFYKSRDFPVDITVGFCDPSSFDTNPGWPLRNLLAYISSKQVSKIRVLCYRDLTSLPSETRSVWMSFVTDIISLKSPFRVSGWERNAQNKSAPKLADLSSLLNPQRLADQAVNLNLQLMKWRIAPTLDLEIVKNTSCLLLGAGTLGTYVARALLGWGVNKITFVDNSKVSYSNPVRQPLYSFEDCFEGGASKATTAAESLRKIYPGVDSSGHIISVPMIGHPITNESKQSEEYEQLVELIESHDAIFLLLDSREARWLPTVIASAFNKIVINAALGFDSFVVMRHGVSTAAQEDRLGCYFCYDVFAPSDSMTDRTLDQMCTVTRPGVALLASGLASELFVSILQHPLGPAAPTEESEEYHHPLGTVPHQLRGFLRQFQQKNIKGLNYKFCSACSDKVVGAWKQDGWTFVKNALNISGYVDEVSGLADVQRNAENLDVDDWIIDDDDEM
ncbi:uncharacterized protein V1516DRAFT_684024 [Lipomyces oligophaga]|uniref:uncharacterized protein n=1 Tax=Lipomyces oligophaga TaxID=45792 RepID=UPI0034CFC4DA